MALAPTRRNPFRLTPKTAPYFFIAPAVIIFAVFMAYPIVFSFIMSFQKLDQGIMVFNDPITKNYEKLLNDDTFKQTLFNSLIILVVQVPIMLALALALAIALNQKFLKARGLFRAVFFLPAITALVAVSVIFKILMNEDNGLINYAISSIGLPKVPWFSSEIAIRMVLVIAVTWRWTGYNMVIYLAGLQGIPGDLYEAATVDGASKWQQFINITVPQLRPVILFTTVFSTIGTLQLFDESYVLTGPGPNDASLTIGAYLYRKAFKQADFGYAATISYALVIIIVILSLVQLRFADEREG